MLNDGAGGDCGIWIVGPAMLKLYIHPAGEQPVVKFVPLKVVVFVG